MSYPVLTHMAANISCLAMQLVMSLAAYYNNIFNHNANSSQLLSE